jgi:hypothetical protein
LTEKAKKHWTDVTDYKNDMTGLQNAINNSPLNSVIYFGDATNTYNLTASISLQPNRVYTGNATLKQTSSTAGTPIFKTTLGNAHDIAINGLVFDANNVGNCIQLGMDTDTTPTSYIQIRNCTFKNTPANSTWAQHTAIWSVSSGFHWSVINNNRFINCGEGVALGNPHFAIVSDNFFDGMTSGNCIWVINYGRAFTYGNGLVFKNNIGRNLYYAGITIFNSGGDTNLPEGVVIEGNIFKDWQPTAPANDYSTCFSLVTGKNYVVANNELLNGVGLYGIESIATNMQCVNNKITGFQKGIILNNSPYAILNGNHFNSVTGEGVIISGVTSPNSKINNNTFRNCGTGVTVGITSDNVIVSNNQIFTTTSGNGIEIVNGGNDNIISDNVIVDPIKNAIQISNGSGTANRTIITKNKISFITTRTYTPMGIRVIATTDTFINGNSVDTNVALASSNYTGLIQLEGVINGCSITGNKITGNISTPIDHRGITMAGSSTPTNVYILNNVVRGLVNGIHLANASTVTNVVINGNHPRECTSPYQFKGGEITSTLRNSEGTQIPTTGAWLKGDRVVNSNPSVGSPKAWVCTATGSPGTWVSEGNL